MITSVVIFGKSYTIRSIPESRLDPQSVGSVDFGKCAIDIAQGLSLDAERETLLHEVIHAVEHDLACGLEERQVTALSVGLWSVAQANPEAMRWILGLNETKP